MCRSTKLPFRASKKSFSSQRHWVLCLRLFMPETQSISEIILRPKAYLPVHKSSTYKDENNVRIHCTTPVTPRSSGLEGPLLSRISPCTEVLAYFPGTHSSSYVSMRVDTSRRHRSSCGGSTVSSPWYSEWVLVAYTMPLASVQKSSSVCLWEREDETTTNDNLNDTYHSYENRNCSWRYEGQGFNTYT